MNILSTAELIGDFTLELKKVGSTIMTVRAARARLVADHRRVTLQGMNEKGPVESVLVHGKSFEFIFTVKIKKTIADRSE